MKITTGERAAIALAIGFCAVLVHAQPEPNPEMVTRANAGSAGLWRLRSSHVIWGLPRQTDNRHNVVYPGETQARPGLSVLVREGFVIGHYDLYKVPAWVCVRWTREDRERLLTTDFGRPFGRDEELPKFAQAGESYFTTTTDMERGHMARHEDNEAWGSDNSALGCRMSNIVPQHKDMNGEAWNDLENMHQDVVADPNLNIDTVWIISGPVFRNGLPETTIANGVAVPMGTFKVIGWFDHAGVFQARGYLVKQEDRVRNDPAHYLVKIRDLERDTGLDFFPDLPGSRADTIETVIPTDVWGSAPAGPAPGPGPGPAAPSLPSVRIVSIVPNPVGDDTQDEAVTVRNEGPAQVNFTGWKLRDASGKTWNLSGTLDPGDERTFKRLGQAMTLNNTGPEAVDLLRPDGSRADHVGYDGVIPAGRILLDSDLR